MEPTQRIPFCKVLIHLTGNRLFENCDPNREKETETA